MIGLTVTTAPSRGHYAGFVATARWQRFSVTQPGATADEAAARARGDLVEMLTALGVQTGRDAGKECA